MKILVATDFSSPAMQAADIAAAIAKKTGPAGLVHLVNSTADWLVSADIPATVILEQRAGEDLEKEASRLRDAGTLVTTDLRHGPAAAEIMHAAAERPPQLAVLGSTGAGMGSRWMVGSVAERVASHVPVPSLIVRDAAPLLAWLQDGKPLRVMCAVDFTASADAAIDFVKQLASWGPVKVEAAYVAPADSSQTRHPSVPSQGEQLEEIQNLERDVWERLHDALGNLPAEVYVRSASGTTFASFLELAREKNADLVVVGSHQRHGLRRLAGPAFSHGVLVHAATNVLCVPLASHHPDFKARPIHSVLVATDFSDPGNDALRYAAGLLPHGGRIKLIHVCHDPSPGLNPVIASEVYFGHSIDVVHEKEEAGARLLDLVPRNLATSSITFSTEVLVHKDVATAIKEAADSCGADVICTGTHGRTRSLAAFLGSTVQSLISMTSKPVLVIHAPTE